MPTSISIKLGALNQEADALEIAQLKVEKVHKPDALSQFVGQISTGPDEATAAWLISTLAA